MFAIIQEVITQPSATFREIADRATVRQAATVVLLAAALSAAEAALAWPGAGVFLTIAAAKLAVYLVGWRLIGALVQVVAGRLFGGAGDLRATLVALGFSAVPLGLSSVLAFALLAFGVRPEIFQLFCLGWAILLAGIATREVHDLSGLKVAGAVTPALVAALALDFGMGRFVNLVRCYAPLPPVTAVTWNETPADAVDLVKNGGFEQAAEPSARPRLAAAEWERAPRNPLDFLCAPVAERDTASRKTGDAGLRLALRGAPQFDFSSAVGQELPSVEAGIKLHLAVAMKTRDAVAAGAMVVFMSGDRDRPYLGAIQTELVSGTTDWKEYRAKGVAPAGAQKLALSLFALGHGEVWMDDVRLLAPRPAPKPAEAKAAPPATVEAAASAVAAKVPADLLKDSPVVFVSSPRDRTADRADTRALRERLEKELVERHRARPVDRRAEVEAGLNDVDFAAGKPLDSKTALTRCGQAGLNVWVASELALSPAGRQVLRVWVIRLPSLESALFEQEIRPAEAARPTKAETLPAPKSGKP